MPRTIDITAVSKLKHADLWKAAKTLGGQSALGRYLGVPPFVIGRWCNLQGTPNHTGEAKEELERKLYEVTGKTFDELFPRELCEAEAFLRSSKTIEATREVELAGLLEYAERTQERLTLDAPNTDASEIKEIISLQLHRLSDRQRRIVELRYGINCDKSHSLWEVSKEIGITRQRVMQIEAQAIRKLQDFKHSQYLVDFAPERTRPLGTYKDPVEVWPSEKLGNRTNATQ